MSMIESQLKSLNPDNMVEALKVFMRCMQEVEAPMIPAGQETSLFTMFEAAMDQ